LKSIDEKDLEHELITLGVDEKLATLAPYITKNIEEATVLSENPNFMELVQFIEDIATLWGKKDVSYPLLFTQKSGLLIQDRDFFKNFLELLLLYFLDLVHYKAHQDITYRFLREQIQYMSDLMSIKEINDVIEEIQTVLEQQTYFINLDLVLDRLSYTIERKR